VIDAFVAAAGAAGARAALLASLPETISPSVRAQCLQAGVIPLQGQREALEAMDLAGIVGSTWQLGANVQLLRPRTPVTTVGALSEFEGKRALAAYGVPVPRSKLAPVRDAVEAAGELGYPVVMKACAASLEHKSDAGGVVLNIRTPAEAGIAASRLGALADNVLIEPMIVDGVAEILVGALIDPQFGLTLLLGAGGVLTELLSDSTSLLPPFTRPAVTAALGATDCESIARRVSRQAGWRRTGVGRCNPGRNPLR
jgi:acetate---CoA ligase (ADP-forming)